MSICEAPQPEAHFDDSEVEAAVKAFTRISSRCRYGHVHLAIVAADERDAR